MNALFDKLSSPVQSWYEISPPLLAGSETQNDHASLEMTDTIVLTSLLIHLLSSLWKQLSVESSCYHQKAASDNI